MPRLTKRRLAAMSGALAAMLAGEEGEGDWPEDVTSEDMENALSWVQEQIDARHMRAGDKK